MSDAEWRVARVEERAREIMGPAAKRWLMEPTRQLSRLTPCELAWASEAGMQVVLTELERHATALRGPVEG